MFFHPVRASEILRASEPRQDGTCSAPYFYRGTCPFSVNLLNYTKGMKATFAANCGEAGLNWTSLGRHGDMAMIGAMDLLGEIR